MDLHHPQSEDSDSDEDSYDDDDSESQSEQEQVPPPPPARVLAPIDLNQFDTDEEDEHGDHSESDDGDSESQDEQEQEQEQVPSPPPARVSAPIPPPEDASDTDGLRCPICFETWSSTAEHYPCCLPCGHLYGMSCIKKWFRLRRSSNKCPQCNSKCAMKDVRRIYASRVLVQDDTWEKLVVPMMETITKKCDVLEGKLDKAMKMIKECREEKEAYWHGREVKWLGKEAEWQKREADLHFQLHRERTKKSELLTDCKGELWRSSVGYQGSQEQRTGCNYASTFGSSVLSHGFVLRKEFQVNGARFFDIDAAGQSLIIARKPSGVGRKHTISKMSLINPYDQEDLSLPSNFNVKDMCVSPFARLALMASLGKKLSIVSLESNNVILNYDLTVPAWSCSWDMKSSHYVYAGLQNGMLLVFDTRQTAGPLESRNGLTDNPIHTICSLSTDSTVPSSMGTLLTASSAGLCQWSVGCGTDKPSMVPETDNQGVCISLSYCSTSDHLVASYRPKLEMLNEFAVSQPFLTPSSAVGQNVQGAHVIIKRTGSCYEKLGSKFANVPSVRLPKYAVMDTKNGSSFASADEVTSELVLQDLPSLATADRLKSYYPIRDIKYDSALHASSLVCLCEDKLQFFSQKNS